MKKLLIASTALLLGLAQNVLAEERTVQETVEASQNPDGTTNPQQYKTVTTKTDRLDSPISSGGFYIEPMLTGTREDETIKTSQLPIINQDTSGESNGFGVGLRMGGHVSEILLLGVDARYSKMTLNDSFYNKADADVYNVAPFVGLQTPLFGIRVIAGYVVAGENNPTSGVQGLDVKFSRAAGWRIGAGIHVLAFGVNLEYQDLTYNSTEIESFGSVAVNNATSIDANTRGYTVSLSFPIEL